jgi:uncharacterized protein (TIGR03067 family)
VLHSSGSAAIAKGALGGAVLCASVAAVAAGVHSLKAPQAPADPAPQSAPTIAATPVPAPRPDTERLQGRWVIIEAEQYQQALPLVTGDRLVVEGDRFLWTAERGEPERIFMRGTTRGTISVDPRSDPKGIDLTVGGVKIPAIYRLEAEGNRLVVCVGDPDIPAPPSAFRSDPNSRQLNLVFERDRSDRRLLKRPVLTPGKDE